MPRDLHQFSDFANNSLPQTGNYTVVIQGGAAANAGSYDLSYVIGGGGVSDGAIASGGSAAATLAVGQMNSFTFSGTSGRDMALAVGGPTFGMWIAVYTPDGHFWTSTGNPNFYTTLHLSQTGTYTVVVFGQAYASTGAFNIYYVQGADTVSYGTDPIPSGAFDSSTMASDELRSYLFAGTTGLAMSAHTGITGTVNMLAFTPDGKFWNITNTSVYKRRIAMIALNGC